MNFLPVMFKADFFTLKELEKIAPKKKGIGSFKRHHSYSSQGFVVTNADYSLELANSKSHSQLRRSCRA